MRYLRGTLKIELAQTARPAILKSHKGGDMDSKPTQQQVRNYMQQRAQSKEPPPTPEQIRRELGWKFGSEKNVSFDR